MEYQDIDPQTIEYMIRVFGFIMVVILVLLSIIVLQNFMFGRKNETAMKAQTESLNFLVARGKREDDAKLIEKMVGLMSAIVDNNKEEKEYREESLKLKKRLYSEGYRKSFQDPENPS